MSTRSLWSVLSLDMSLCVIIFLPFALRLQSNLLHIQIFTSHWFPVMPRAIIVLDSTTSSAFSHTCSHTLTDKLDRTLIAPSHALEAASWNPSLYRNLKHLMISFSSDGRQSQTTRLKRIFSPPTIPLVPWFPPQLTSLTMTKLWRIDVPLLKTVASAFPSVKILHLSCSEQLDVSCCWTCFEESSTAVVHSPIPNYFNDITKLTVR